MATKKAPEKSPATIEALPPTNGSVSPEQKHVVLFEFTDPMPPADDREARRKWDDALVATVDVVRQRFAQAGWDVVIIPQVGFKITVV